LLDGWCHGERLRSLLDESDVVTRAFTNELSKLVVGALHVGMMVSNVLAREREKLFVVRADELVPAGTIDDATHEHLQQRVAS
jgi:hypothetical protein